LIGKEDAVRLVVSSPTAVCIASTNPTYRVFINDSVRSPGGSLLTVYVDPMSAVVVSAYYNRSFPRLSSDRIIMAAIDKHSTSPAQMTADYDQDADVLYVLAGQPRAAEGEDLPGGIVRRYALDDAAPCGVTVIGYHPNRWDQKPRELARIVAEHLGAGVERVRSLVAVAAAD
jgi:hypothetical protein